MKLKTKVILSLAALAVVASGSAVAIKYGIGKNSLPHEGSFPITEPAKNSETVATIASVAAVPIVGCTPIAVTPIASVPIY